MMATETVIGRVSGISETNGWMEASVLQENGRTIKIATKDLKRWGDLRPGLYIKADCSVSEKPNPRGGQPFRNYWINGWAEAGDAAPYDPGNIKQFPSEGVNLPASEDVNPWPGKDRAIAMESAYSSAARFLAGTNAEPEALRLLALSIYSDVERARNGEIVIDDYTEPE